ncbi:MAG: translocation/assembly module TamB domain-containing protein [Caulobacterales bacterium]
MSEPTPTTHEVTPPKPPIRPRRRSRPWLVAAGWLLAAILALLVTARFGVLTGPGHAFIEGMVNGRKIGRVGRLHVEGLDGDIWRDFSIRRLTISDDHGVWLDAESLRVRWRYPQLLQRQVDVEEVDAARVGLQRQPILGPKAAGGGTSVSVRIDKLIAKVEMAPAFSYRYGLYDMAGSLEAGRLGGAAGHLSAVSLTHAGDRLDADFDLGRDKTVSLALKAQEAEGGALAGVLGLAPDRPFYLTANATGTTSQGRFQVSSRSGAATPIEAAGAWSPAGGQAQGDVTLAASRLLTGYQMMLGPQARFQVTGARAADGFYGLSLIATSENVDLTAKGEADIGRMTTAPVGLAVTLVARSASRVLSWPPMGAARFAGALTGDRDRWVLAGTGSVDAPGAYGYRLARVEGPVRLSNQKGQLTLDASVNGEGGAGSGLAAALLGGRPHAAAQLIWLADGRLLMKSLEVTGPGLKVTGDGQMGLFGGLTFKGQASLANLAAAHAGAKGLVTASWSASQDRGGRPWSFTLDAGATDFASGLGEPDRLLGPTPRLKGDATFDGHAVSVTHANLVGAAGDANAAGLIGGDGALKLQLDWRAKGPFELGPLEIAGAAKGSGALTGTLTNPRADLDADFDSIDLPGLTLTGARVTVSLLKGPADTNGALALGASSPYGPAKLDTTFRFQNDGLDLTGLNAEAGGAHAEGSVSLRQGQPSSANLSISVGPGAFLTKGQAAGRLVIVDAQGVARANLTANAKGADLKLGAGLIVQTASVFADGPLDKLPYRLQATGFTTHGSWRGSGSGVISAVKADYGASFEGAGRLRNADFRTLEPAEIRIGQHESSLKLAAEVGGGRADVNARQAGGALQASANLANVSLGLLDQDFTGRFDAAVNLKGEGGQLAGDMNATLAGAGEKGAQGAPTVDGQVKASLSGDQITLDAQLGNAQGLMSRAHLVLPAEATAAPFRIAIVRTRPMRGDFSAEGEVSPLWDLLMGGERSLSGQVKAQGTLAGTIADPRAEGEASLQNGGFSDTETGLKLRGVALTARLADNAVDVSQFTGADAAGGQVSGAGQISLKRDGASSFRLTLKGFRLLDNDIATAAASGQATLSRAADGKVKLTGALTVDRADVAANPPVPSGVTPMDVIEVNREVGSGGHLQTEASHGPAVDLDMSLKAGRGVFLKGRGLNVELSLDAHVAGSTAAPVLSGTARVVRGDYDFAGKRFEFDNRGVVYLATSAEAIRLDLTATRDDPSLTAVIRIEGTAAKPKITLTSSPILPNDEVLSQVLFGSSAAQLSPLQGAQLASALTALAGGGGFDVVGNLRNFAHLDRLALGGGDANGVTVSGGKYVTDNIYMELTGGGRTGPSASVEWRVRKDLSVVSTVAGPGGDSRLSVRWRKDY